MTPSGIEPARYIIYKINIIGGINVYISLLHSRSIGGKSVVHSWGPIAMNGPTSNVGKIYIFSNK